MFFLASGREVLGSHIHTGKNRTSLESHFLVVIKFLVFPTSVFRQTDEFFRQLILFEMEQQQNISEELNFSEKTFFM